MFYFLLLFFTVKVVKCWHRLPTEPWCLHSGDAQNLTARGLGDPAVSRGLDQVLPPSTALKHELLGAESFLQITFQVLVLNRKRLVEF